jgi:hypothetical protein
LSLVIYTLLVDRVSLGTVRIGTITPRSQVLRSFVEQAPEAPTIRNRWSVLVTRNARWPLGIVLQARSKFDIGDEQGTTTGDPNYRGMGNIRPTGGRRYQRVRGARLEDRTDPHARERAIEIARHDPPQGFSPDAAAAEVREVLDSIGDTCPECTTLAE